MLPEAKQGPDSRGPLTCTAFATFYVMNTRQENQAEANLGRRHEIDMLFDLRV